MDGKEFWNKIDMLLSAKNMTIAAMSRETGIPLSTIYRQRERCQLPKMKEFKMIENLLDYWMDESKEEVFSVSDHEKMIIAKYREQEPAVQAAIDRMLGLEKKSGDSGIKVG